MYTIQINFFIFLNFNKINIMQNNCVNKNESDAELTPSLVPGRGGIVNKLENGLELYRADANLLDFILKNPKPQYTLSTLGPHGDVVDMTYVDSLFSQRSTNHGCSYAENTCNVAPNESAKGIRTFCLEDGNGSESTSKCYKVNFVNDNIICGVNDKGSKCISLR